MATVSAARPRTTVAQLQVTLNTVHATYRCYGDDGSGSSSYHALRHTKKKKDGTRRSGKERARWPQTAKRCSAIIVTH